MWGLVFFVRWLFVFLQETYEIEDCLVYDPLTTNNNLFSGSGLSASYSSNGLSVTGNTNADSFYLYQGTLPSTFSIEYKFVDITFESGTNRYSTEVYVKGVGLGKNNTNGLFTTSTGGLSWVSGSLTSGDIIKVEYNGSNVKFYINNTLITTLSTSSGNTGFKTYNARNIQVKDMKIKAL